MVTGTIVAAYRPANGRHDTAVDAAGTPRPGWDRLLADLDRLGPDELDRRQRAADQLMQAESASLRLHGGPGVPGPERVAASPYVVTAAEWDDVSAGLVERAEVLAAVARDLAGPRELLRAGVVPVEAVATHPAFLPGWRTDNPPGLVTVGTDLVVDAAGRFRVQAHVTDVARGDGQALLARSVVGRVLPESIAPAGVADHDTYFRALRTRLADLAPVGRSSPRTVVLAGSPEAPGYVEDAFLAIHLGYHLAEVADVVVRHGQLWLRSLDGAERVDVVLRRTPEAGLDPVEDPALAGDGVPGIVQAERDGGIALANPYGAGLAAPRTLEPFLDDVARFFLGRGLRLPGVPTLWCGDPDHRAEVMAAPERFVFHDADPLAGGNGASGGTLDGVDLADWLARIAARPERYVAQVDMPLATTPCWEDGILRPRSVALRTQILLDGDRATVLPGGHGRVLDPVAPLADDRAAGAAATRLGLDVWVVDPRRRDRSGHWFGRSSTQTSDQNESGEVELSESAEPGPTVTAEAVVEAGPAIPQVDLRRSLPTRAAEAMFWMGRSVERAEMSAGAVLVYLTEVVGADIDDGSARSLAAGLRAVSGGVGHPLPATASPDIEAEVRAALVGWPTGVVASLRSTTANARRARQLLSSRTWRVLAMLDAEADALSKALAGSGDELGQVPHQATLATRHDGQEPRSLRPPPLKGVALPAASVLASDAPDSPWTGQTLPDEALATFDATEVLDRVLVPLAALSGLTSEGVVRGPAWRFLDLGRRLERALLVLGLVEATLDDTAGPTGPGPVTPLRLEVTLAVCESLVAYRRSFRSDSTVEAVGDLLLGDPDNPRSVRFQLDRMTVDLLELPDRPTRHRQLGELRAAQVALARHLPLGSGWGDGADGAGGVHGPATLPAAAQLVLAVRPHLLDIGQGMARGWFGTRPGTVHR